MGAKLVTWKPGQNHLEFGQQLKNAVMGKAGEGRAGSWATMEATTGNTELGALCPEQFWYFATGEKQEPPKA